MAARRLLRSLLSLLTSPEETALLRFHINEEAVGRGVEKKFSSELHDGDSRRRTGQCLSLYYTHPHPDVSPSGLSLWMANFSSSSAHVVGSLRCSFLHPVPPFPLPSFSPGKHPAAPSIFPSGAVKCHPFSSPPSGWERGDPFVHIAIIKPRVRGEREEGQEPHSREGQGASLTS